MLSPVNSQPLIKNPIAIFTLLFLIVFLSASFGIYTRQLSFMAIFWLPNPLLLGLFLRFPHFRRWYGWLGAIVGYFAADLIAGTNFYLTSALTLANLMNVATALLLLKVSQLDYNKFNHGLTFFFLFIIFTVSSGVGALTAVLTVPHTPDSFIPFDRIQQEFVMWWMGEIQNMVIILPIVLTCPSFSKIIALSPTQLSYLKQKPNIVLPILVITVSTIAAYHFNGPGALMFPVAGLLWAALSYHFFTITLINLVVCSTLFYSVNQFYLNLSEQDFLATTVSARIGVFMMALAPLTVALISHNRSTLFNQLRHHVDYDNLTQAMSRRNFLESTLNKLRTIKPQKKPFALLMIDLDFFKKINDNYGHPVGDATLQHFVKITQQTLREHDLFGRLGGEEFAIFLADIQPSEALRVAKRIQENLEKSPLILSDQSILVIRVSIGLLHHNESNDNLEELLGHADQALYKAKELGRNQVYVYNTLNV